MNRSLVRIISIVAIMLSATVVFSQQTPAEFERLPSWARTLSSSGRYIVGLLVLTEQTEILEEEERTGELPEVSYRVRLWENNRSQVQEVAEIILNTPLLTDAIPLFDLALSPDETLLAVREDEVVRILRIPTLESEQVLEAPTGQPLNYGELAWSLDSHYLAFYSADLELSVWDRQTGDVTTRTNADEFVGSITAVLDGWIMRLPWVLEGEQRLFRACDTLVEQCRVYTLDDLDTATAYESVSAAPNGQGVLVLLEDDTARWLERNANGEFVASADPVLSEISGTIPERPPFFSADSRFVAVSTYGDVRRTDVFEVGSWELLTPSISSPFSGFMPNVDALVWWEDSKQSLGITCIGHQETAASVGVEDVSVIARPLNISGNGDYVLVENGALLEDSNFDEPVGVYNVIGLYNVLVPLPEVEC